MFILGVYFVIAICFLIVFIYYKTSSFTSRNGILLFLLGFFALFLRAYLFKWFPPLAIYNRDGIFESLILLFIPLILFIAYCIYKQNGLFKRRDYYFFKLLVPYLLFGGLEQLFFLTVFTDSVFYIFNNLTVVFVISIIFYLIFHLDWKEQRMKKILPWLFLFSIINTYIYLKLGNILPQMIVHGVAATFAYSAFSNTNMLRKRLNKKTGLLEKIN